MPQAATKLSTYLVKQERRLCRFLQSLVRVPTVNPPGENYLECVQIFEDKLKSIGLKTKVVRVPDRLVKETLPDCAGYPRYNLLGRLDVGAKKTLHFNGHYDVVPTSGKWKFGPFEPKIVDGWLYGRGSSDMKGPNAACCFALEALMKSGQTPKVNIEVSFTADEEVGGELGAGYIVKQGLTKADYAVVCEGGGGRYVGLGHNGIVWLDVELTGKAAHGSRPAQGVNAFEQMAQLAVSLQKLKKVYVRRKFVTPNGKIIRPTINIGGVFGVGPGSKVNTVPAKASFSIDRRIIPTEKLSEVEREIRKAIRDAKKDIPRLRARVTRRMGFEPCLVDSEDPLPQTFAAAVRNVHGGKIKFSSSTGFTDLHFFVVDGGIPSVGYGAGGQNIHGIDERVRVRDLVDTAKVYAQVMATGKWSVIS